MVGVSVTTNAKGVAAIMRGHPAVVRRRVGTVVRFYGMSVQTRAKANASGSPGPGMVTGDYRRSITMAWQRTAAGARSTIGTNRAQGRRLEYGFTGADALGRVYNQAPRPHMHPALYSVRDAFVAAVKGVAETWAPRASGAGTWSPGSSE